MSRLQWAQAAIGISTWHLSDNPVWNVPPSIGELRFDLTLTPFPFASVRSVRGLAVDQWGRVYGIRTLLNARESGYALEGRVRLAGKRFRAFTSSQLFQRPDGSLCSVATLHVCLPGDGKDREAPGEWFGLSAGHSPSERTVRICDFIHDDGLPEFISKARQEALPSDHRHGCFRCISRSAASYGPGTFKDSSVPVHRAIHAKFARLHSRHNGQTFCLAHDRVGCSDCTRALLNELREAWQSNPGSFHERYNRDVEAEGGR